MRYPPSTAEIVAECARTFDVPEQLIYGHNRARAIIRARHAALSLCYELTYHSGPELARLFDMKDHTTVYYSVRKLREHPDPLVDRLRTHLRTRGE